MFDKEFKKALSSARRGDKIIYHTGSLMLDRKRHHTRPNAHDVDAVATAAWDAAGMVWDKVMEQWRDIGDRQCVLVQRKVAETPFGIKFDYIAIKI
jgi:hypothetical protein